MPPLENGNQPATSAGSQAVAQAKASGAPMTSPSASEPVAPDGYATLGEAAARYVERLRFSSGKAERRVVRDITEGTLPAWILPRFEKFDFEPDYTFEFTGSEAVRPSRMMDVRETPGGGIRLSRGIERLRLVIDDDDIERLINELAPAPMPVMARQVAAPAAEPPPTAAAAAPRRPGRPTEYDWDAVKSQVRRRIFRYGLPKKSSVLVNEVLSLFGRDPPEPRTIERKIAQWWPELEQLSEELNGPCEITPASNERQ